jgi:D-glycero-D-manno-heptose 1,7-bisphosphate phosphatase
MLLKAQRDLGIDMARSILVGDKPTDVAAGLAAEVGTNLQLVETDVKPGGNFRLICHLADVFVHLESSVSGLAVNSIDPHG